MKYRLRFRIGATLLGLLSFSCSPKEETEADKAEAVRSETKDNPYVNSLGMKFVPVPGTDTLFCIWETRVKDYAAYAVENAGVDDEWKDFEFGGHSHKQAPDHPAVKVSWEDAKAFCAWLSKKDGVTYRLPTDHEWSVAVGIGDQEDAKASPYEKTGVIEGFPWGAAWPPPQGAGNFGGSESAYSYKIEGYKDDYPFTAPVGSFSADRLGLHDLSGNVWEWCEDWYNPNDQKSRVLRGGSWIDYGFTEFHLRSSNRNGNPPTNRYSGFGFRVVVEATADQGEATKEADAALQRTAEED
ncbi:MAG: sulfatase activating formylglycine-generating enzyme [Verrucomicrobiales bacterium]